MGLNYTFAGQTGPISLSTLDTALGDASVAGFKNKIIGGDFTVNPWQRGTSFTAPSSGTYSADRWLVSNTSAAVYDVLKTADAPTAAQAGVFTQHCFHVDVTTADASIAVGDIVVPQQRIEGLNVALFGFGQAGTRYVTLSFWHKHTKTGTYCVAFRNSAIDRSYVAEYTQDVTDTWEKATITIPVDTTGTWLYDSGVGLTVSFPIAAGSNFQTTANTWAAGNFHATANQVNALDSTANNFKIALVQLEAGSVATPFETRSVQQEYQLAARYYYRTTQNSSELSSAGYSTSTTTFRAVVNFPVTMRSAPAALEQTGTATDYRVLGGGASSTAGSSVPTFNNATQYLATVTQTVASGLVTYNSGLLSAASGISSYLGFSAEL